MRVDFCVRPGAEKSKDRRSNAQRHRYVPINTSTTLKQNGSDHAGENERKQCRGHGFLDCQSSKNIERRNQKNSSDTDSTDQHAYDKRNREQPGNSH